MKCLAPIEIYPRVVVYCDKEIEGFDAEGNRYHEGPCEPPHPMDSRLSVYWRKRDEEKAKKKVA